MKTRPLFLATHARRLPVMQAVAVSIAMASIALTARAASPAPKIVPETSAGLLPLSSVRLLDDGPFPAAVKANRDYLLAIEPDRLLAPFLREAKLPAKAKSYGNWENSGLDGHTAGHYLAALANMIASGADTPAGEFNRRLDYMLDEIDRCQQANGDGYVGGVPGSRQFWPQIAAGNIGAIRSKWVPWYNVHKTFAGLRDAYLVAGKEKARVLLVRLGDWCVKVTSKLSDAQMQQMLGTEHGGMNEVLADIYAITGDPQYLQCAKKFDHQETLMPLERSEDRLTGKHANTQIPKIVGFEQIATLSGDKQLDKAARFFWETVTKNRSVAFGGNSVSEHFNDSRNFRTMIESREGPETCNTYNMLRLTEALFATEPRAAYADFYERALYNHILSAIHCDDHPGYVYFTPIRPGHYRVYSQPDQGFWCCVGTGMENPGKYGKFIYAKGKDAVYVNLFIASEAKITDGVTVRQETKFPYEPRTKLTMKLAKPTNFTLHLRHPVWAADGFAVKLNGTPLAVSSTPSSYADIKRDWADGDNLEVELPMRTTTERLPDKSNWVAILHGPIVLAAAEGTQNLVGLRANSGRMAHVASGPMLPLDQVPTLLATPDELVAHIAPDPSAGPLHFRLKDVAMPAVAEGLALMPFFSLHDARYQMYWELTTADAVAARRDRLAADERAKAVRAAATLDSVAAGEQQPEVEHDFKGESAASGSAQGRHWREGQSFQYTLDTKGEKAVELEITYWGSDNGRTFDIFANQTRVATVQLKAERAGQFVAKRFAIPATTLADIKDGRVTIKFVAKTGLAGRVYDVRLMKPDRS